MPFVSSNFMANNFMLSGDNVGSGKFWTLLTYSVSHYNIMHIFSNMFGFYFFGSAIEKMYGPKVLLQLYIAGALMGALFQLSRSSKQYGGSHVGCLGASSSLSAVLSFFILNSPNEVIYLLFFPMPAWAFGTCFFAYSLFMMNSNSGTSHAAHFGGFMGGVAMHFARRGKLF